MTDFSTSISPHIKREKRSLSLHGHRTSIALETPFWAILDGTAQAQDLSQARLIALLDDARIAAKSPLGLAAYLRVWAILQVQQHHA